LPPSLWGRPARFLKFFLAITKIADTPSYLVLHEGDSGQLRGNAAAVKDLSTQPSMLASTPRAHAAPMISRGKISSNPIYYVSQVAPGPEAYYSGSGEKPGTWVGRGCADLDLSGEVTEEALGAVLGGKDPATGDWLVTGKAASPGRLGGYDLTFSAPKGVSLLASLSKQQVAATVRGSHDAAVIEALAYLEDHATWARRGHNGLRTEATSGMLAAAFRHRTSRADDPQLHTHVVVANLVHGNDGRWSAIWGKPIYAQARTAGFVYQAALRANLTQSLGIEWSPVRQGMGEPAGFSAAQLSAFSTRRRQVTAAMADHGASSAKAAQVATLATRAAKCTDHDQSRQLTTWWATAERVGLGPEALDAMVGASRDVTKGAEDQAEVTEALVGANGLTAHSSSFERRDVIRAWAEAAGDGAHLAQAGIPHRRLPGSPRRGGALRHYRGGPLLHGRADGPGGQHPRLGHSPGRYRPGQGE